MPRIDTSIEGFEYVGIKLTEEQYEDLCQLNILMKSDDRKDIPVFNIMIVLKTLGLLPVEMMYDKGSECSSNCSTDYSDNNIYNSIQRKFGKFKD